MNSFPQLSGEPADAFEQLLLHRDFGPSRQFSQTANVVGCSESTLRRRAEQWNWFERLAEYDSGMLHQASEARTKDDFERYKHQLEAFRQEQLARARTVGDRAEELLEMVEHSVSHHLEAGTILQGREIPSVMAAACKALEGAMNIEATALGVAQLMDEIPGCCRLRCSFGQRLRSSRKGPGRDQNRLTTCTSAETTTNQWRTAEFLCFSKLSQGNPVQPPDGPAGSSWRS
jgi:hypothetical protein